MSEYERLKKQKDAIVERQRTSLEKELVRYKAITELAVKGLEEVEHLISISESSPNLHEDSKDLFISIRTEIERLQNELDK